jgi:hypothetical protein
MMSIGHTGRHKSTPSLVAVMSIGKIDRRSGAMMCIGGIGIPSIAPRRNLMRDSGSNVRLSNRFLHGNLSNITPSLIIITPNVAIAMMCTGGIDAPSLIAMMSIGSIDRHSSAPSLVAGAVMCVGGIGVPGIAPRHNIVRDGRSNVGLTDIVRDVGRDFRLRHRRLQSRRQRHSRSTSICEEPVMMAGHKSRDCPQFLCRAQGAVHDICDALQGTH